MQRFLLVKSNWFIDHKNWQTKEILAENKKQAEIYSRAWNDETNKCFNHSAVLVFPIDILI